MTSRGSNASSRRRDSDLEIRRNKEKLQKAIEDAELRTKHLEQEIKRQEAELDRSPVGNDNDNESVQQVHKRNKEGKSSIYLKDVKLSLFSSVSHHHYICLAINNFNFQTRPKDMLKVWLSHLSGTRKGE